MSITFSPAGHGERITTQEIAKAYFGDTSVKARQKRKDDRKAVATGVGATAAGAGLVGGGIPGMRPRSQAYYSNKGGPLKDKPKQLAAAGKGGIFGYRQHAHENEIKRIQEHTPGWHDNAEMRHFMNARGAGEIASEKKIVRHMKMGRKLSHGALVGGAGLMVYGSQRKPKLVPREDRITKRLQVTSNDPHRDATALAAGGAVGTVGSLGAAHGLKRQGLKWNERTKAALREAEKNVPGTGEFKSRKVAGRAGVPDTKPTHSGEGIGWGPERFFSGRTESEVKAAGKARGAASKNRYFARVYGTNAHVLRRYVAPTAAVASAAGGVSLYRQHKAGKPVRKSLVEMREVEKSYFSAANRASRVAARRSAREARQAARGGALIQRKVAKPVAAEIDRSVDRANAALKATGEEVVRNVERRAPRIGLKTGLAIGTGVGGGLTLGELGRQEIRRQYERPVRKDDIPAGYYPYLLPTIREDIAGIPETRRNPISPLQQIAGSRLMADGTRKIRSHNPFFRTRRTREGMKQVVMGQQMVNRGAGEPL